MQQTKVPDLGSQVPSFVVKARNRQCLTDIKHYDPCASVQIDGKSFTIAWDTQTKAITYTFTDDLHFQTDNELSVGGSAG
jgi:hypothetical protein